LEVNSQIHKVELSGHAQRRPYVYAAEEKLEETKQLRTAANEVRNF